MPARSCALRASTARSHSVSTPIDRREKLADPMRTSSSSTTITFEWTKVGTFCAREATGYTRRRRWCDVGVDQRPEDLVAEGAHRVLLEPAIAVVRRDDDHLRAVRLAQSCGQRVGERVVGEVLALDVDRPLGLRDRIEKQRLALADRAAASSEPGTVRAIATSTSVRSGVTSRGQRSSVDGLTARHPLVAERAPAIARQLAKARGDRSRHHRLNFVIRPVRLAHRRRSAPARRRDARWCPSDGWSDRCRRRTRAGRRRR